MASKKGANLIVKARTNGKDEKSVEISNAKTIRIFIKKFKKSGIIKELKDRRYAKTKGQKNREKRQAAIRRAKKKSRQ